MSLKKKAAIAVILFLILAQNSAGFQPRPIEPLPQSAFREIQVDRKVVIHDTFEAPSPPTKRPKAPVPTPTVKSTPKATPKLPNKSKGSIKGLASYYCCTKGYPSGGYYAAAGPKLRIAMGGAAASTAAQPWKGKMVKVCGSKGCERVKLVDWCQCYWKQSNEKVIDLYKGLFFHIGAERGTVTISW